ncbi:MAG TPA: rhodanese-like domain-containing protein [Chloroflexota bacterium]|nr:rhodanese-like domain-containing protein [Chloroflexota bacterium]
MRAQELARQMEAGDRVQALDVRTPAEFETVHIPGSHNLPLDLVRGQREALSAARTPLVLVCRSGSRAREAQVLLHSAGHDDVDVLEGGIAAWEQAGLPVERGRQRWSLERQVRGVAGGLVLAGALGGLFVWRPLGGLAAAIGGGLLYSALTDTCGLAALLARLPYNRGAGCDVHRTLAALVRASDERPGPAVA